MKVLQGAVNVRLLGEKDCGGGGKRGGRECVKLVRERERERRKKPAHGARPKAAFKNSVGPATVTHQRRSLKRHRWAPPLGPHCP